MHRRIFQLAVFLLAAISLAPAQTSETVERVVVVVNGHAILLSEWDSAARLEGLLGVKPLATSAEERRAILERLVDQQLLRAELERSNLQHATTQEVDEKIRQLRKEFPGAETEDGWKAVLSRYGVSREELQEAVAFQLVTLRLIDARLRPTAQADQASVEEYYRDTYLPSVRRAEGKPQPLSEVAGTIKEILAQQKMGDLTTAWLQNLRAQSDIRWNIPENAVAK
jgi:DNA polymerase III gamma/tau subunit